MSLVTMGRTNSGEKEWHDAQKTCGQFCCFSSCDGRAAAYDTSIAQLVRTRVYLVRKAPVWALT